MNTGRLLPGGLITAAALAGALIVAQPAAAALTDATWTGGSTTSHSWSDTANWSAGAPSSPIGDLTFGDLASCDAGSAAAGSACYTATDNLGAAAVDHIQIGGGKQYTIAASPAATITLDGNGATPNVGISARPSGSNKQTATIAVPITLGAAQDWDVSGGLLAVNSVAGSFPLTLDLSSGDVQANDIETESITASGPGSLQLDQHTGSPEKLPAVTVNDAVGHDTGLAVASTSATSGAISVAGTDDTLSVLTGKTPEARLRVDGSVALDATSDVEFDIDGNTTSAGTDSSQLSASGTVSFGGAVISLWQARTSGSCATLTKGKTFTIVRGGTLAGQIKVGGKLISPGQSATEAFHSNTCAGASSRSALVSYGATAITAAITGPPAASGQAPSITGTAKVGDKLTLKGNGGWTGTPAPTYRYQWNTCAGIGCTAIKGATASSLTLTSALVGKTIKLQVTAANSYGSASALSNAIGPVKAVATTVTPSLSSRARAALGRLAHPRGRRALRLLLRRGLYRTRFSAPSAGRLTIVWRTTRGRHTDVVARGSAHPGRARSLLVTVRLTRAGRRLLRAHRLSLRVTATNRFLVPGGHWITFRRRFTL
jgi:hypothetical protein